jgi:restriction endonuclease S subunit
METGGSRPTNLRTHDSLHGDLTQTGYDVILANEPFGLKGLKHADCCERVKHLKIRGTKSEPLFLQLMMVSLNQGGRCAVVVPDGMLVNTSELHDGTRKYLLDHFELKRVIKMRGQFFMNTGIQPSILFFENTGNPTAAVEFWDVEKNKTGDIKETMVLSVPRDQLDASCSLDMRRYQEVKEVENLAGFPMVNISEKCSMAIGGTPLRSKSEYYENGQYVWVSVSELNNKIIMDSKEHINDEGVKHSNVKLVKKGSVLMSFKMSIGKCAIAGIDLYTNEAIVAFYSKDETILSNQYLFYYLSLRDLSNAGKGSIGAGSMNKESLSELMMPLPPLSIQHEIVATLNRIYQPGTAELAETLKLTNQAMDLVLAQPNGAKLEPIVEAQRLMRKSAQMATDVKSQLVADVKAQMVDVFNASLKSKNSSWLDISSFCKFERSKIQASKNTPGDYPFISLSVSTHHVNLLDDSEHVFISAIPAGNRKMKVQYQSGKCSYSSLMFHCILDKEKIVPKYFYYYLYYNMDILNEYVIGVQPKFTYESFLSRKITIPTLEVQADIIRRIGIIESQLTALENLGKQAEDNARFILESYLQSHTESPYSSEAVWNSHEETLVNEVVEESSSAAASSAISAPHPLKMKKPAVSKK